MLPSHAAVSESDTDWDTAVRSGLPPEAGRAELRPGPVVLVERPGREGRPDQRWAFVRGPRLDVVIEQVGVPLGSALLTSDLQEALATLAVPANVYLTALREQTEWMAAMDDADAAVRAGDAALAARRFSEARDIARDTWLHSLTGLPVPEIPAAIADAEAALALTKVTGTAVLLDEATGTLFRARRSLGDAGGPVADRIDTLMEAAMRMHGEMEGGGDPPVNAMSAALARSRLLVGEVRRAVEGVGSPVSGCVASTAVEAATTAVAYARRRPLIGVPPDLARRLTEQGVTDPDAQLAMARTAIEVAALDHLVAAGAAAHASAAMFGQYAARPVTGSWLLAARRLVELSPTPDRLKGLVHALGGHAIALISLGDGPSLDEASRLLTEAEGLLDDAGGEPELVAQVCFQLGWLRYSRREIDGGLAIVDRALDAARRAGANRIERAAHSLRSQFLLHLDRTDEAVAEARSAVGGHDDAESAHRLNLAVTLHAAGDADAALAEVRGGLAATIPGEVTTEVAMRLLFVAAQLLEPVDLRRSLAFTEAAELVVDVRRMSVGDSVDRVSFDDAQHHRELVASLVQRRVAAGDVEGALATADRYRARSLVPLSGLQTGPGDDDPVDVGPVPDSDASLDAQVAYVAAVARAKLTRGGVPPPLAGDTLVATVEASGRATVVLHPSGDELIALVVRPGRQPVVRVAAARTRLSEILTLTDDLRRQLGIVVASRAARGELPPRPFEEARELFTDETAEAADAELDRLRTTLHDALLSDVLSLLDAGEPLVVVPYRELAVIPLPVLVGDDGRGLGERHPVSVLPSIASLGAMPAPTSLPPTAVVVGDPALSPDTKLARLPGAAAEAEWVYRALVDAGIATSRLFADEATESAFRDVAYNARLVHLACHAALREPASASPLFLTPSPPDDGLLLANEVTDLLLDGALVVVAACESGLGRATADGVLGLGHAFLQAGARAVVLSLWRVSDAATARLMRELYAGLLGTAPDLGGERLDVAAALARAQAVTRADIGAHPSTWGPWLVVGDGGWRLA